MSGFTKILQKSDEYNAAKSSLDRRELPLGIIGLPAVCKAHYISALCENESKKALILCADEPGAIKLCEDLNVFSSAALYYPVRDFNFRSSDSSSKEYEQQRIGVLSKILAGDYKYIVCSVQAAMQLTVPSKELKRRSARLIPGEDIEEAQLVSALTLAGYVRSPQVDGVGQFSLRGGIVDFFPPDRSDPVRTEFWGDTVDSLTAFDVETQRRTDVLDEVLITPAGEVLFENDEILCEKLRDFLSAVKGRGASKVRETISQDISRLENKIRLSCLDRYLPLAYEKAETVFDYTKNDLLFVCESSGVKQKAESSQKLLQEDIKAMVEDGYLTRGLDCFTITVSELFGLYETRGAVFADNLARGGFDVPVKSLVSVNAAVNSGWDGTLSYLLEDLEPYLKRRFTCVVAAGTEKNAKELAFDLETEGVTAHYYPVIPAEFPSGSVSVVAGSVGSGFGYPTAGFELFSLSRKAAVSKRRIKKRFSGGKGIASLEELSRGDYVVHAVHGIGIFDGIKSMKVEKATKDFIKINYRGNDVLYVPVTQLDLVSKYISPKDTDRAVRLNRLGSDEWKKTKSRVRAAVGDMAQKLTELYAKRLSAKGFAFSQDIDMQSDFERRFEFDETDDQLIAVDEIKSDMEKPFPMDRLLCGDVGFGKTEVALRAAFKCVADGKQCAVLVPTTILAFQHFQTIKKRFDGFPIEIEMLSRFRSTSERTKIKKRLKSGGIDLVVGTHSIIARTVEFKDLGLLIVDEEQRFGVAQKEKLKEKFPHVDVLTLSATPIPRTLNMAMTGIRDMSVLEMPPLDRHPVQTYVVEQDIDVLCEAIERELRRGGQVYYLHNRTETIERTAAKLKERLPDARIGIGHGKMSEEELSEVWRQLLEGEIDILVCTTIIETGVDVPNANTLIIENADRLGLAQLHQIRGRVGRSARRAFAYLTYDPRKQLSPEAERRLSAIREYTEFGSGFRIAMRDLEIRGAGNVLGAEQHGHMEAVGYDMYLKLLSQAVEQGKNGGEEASPQEDAECLIDIAVDAHIPETYIDSVKNRLFMYKRIACVRTKEDAQDVVDELIDRFGEPPESVLGLIDIAMIRNRCINLGIYEISQRGAVLLIFIHKLEPLSLAMLSKLMRGRVMISAAKTKPYLSVRLADYTAAQTLDEVLKILESAEKSGNQPESKE